MKKILVLIFVVSFFVPGLLVAEDHSVNTNYEKLRIRSLARENFNNKGRSKYVYVNEPLQTEDYKNGTHTVNIGDIELEEGSKVRKLNVVLDMDKIQKEYDKNANKHRTYRKEVKIGTITGDEDAVDRVSPTIILESDSLLTY